MAAGDLITSDYQFELRGRVFGPGTGYNLRLASWTGLGVPAPKITDTDISHLDGAIGGQDRRKIRTVTWQMYVVGESPAAAMADARDAAQAFDVSQTDLELHGRLPELGRFYLVGRPRGLDLNLSWIGLNRVEMMGTFVALDPHLYSPTLHQTVVPIFEGSGGLTYPVTYPKDYGTSGSGGSTKVPNDGTVGVWPRIVITGPDSGTVQPIVLENLTTGEEIRFTSGGGLTIPAGSTLVVDTHPARRVVRFTDGANRWNTVAGTRWFPIAPGGVDMRFRAQGNLQGVTVTVETRDAYL